MPVAANIQIQGQTNPNSQLILSGNVKVNGKSVPSGLTISSGDTIETAANASAVVSLGKLGRVEILPSSKLKVSFDSEKMDISIEAGGLRVSKPEDFSATISTKDVVVYSTGAPKASFSIDTSCGDTWVSSYKGTVVMRKPGETQTITAGSQGASGTPTPGCKRAKVRSPHNE